MFNILKLKDNTFVLKTKKNAIYCSTQEKLIIVMRELGVSYEEIEIGLSQMIKNDDNLADYGVHKQFIFSKKVA